MYLEIKKNILAPRTYEYYRNEINSLIIPLSGHIKLSELRPAHVQQFVQYLQGDIRKKNNEQDNTKLSPATIKRKLAVLQSILKQAVKLDIITTNPANAEKLTLPKTVKPDIEIFTKQEAAEILYCIGLIRLLKAEKSQQALKLGTAWKGEDWIFTQWDGSIMYPQTPSAQWRDFLKKHGFRHRKFHSLRHTSAALLLYGGANVKQVQERLGHGDLKTTNLYLHYIS